MWDSAEVNERNGFGCNGRIEDRMARGAVAGRHAMNVAIYPCWLRISWGINNIKQLPLISWGF